jgi:hypothetical protein
LMSLMGLIAILGSLDCVEYKLSSPRSLPLPQAVKLAYGPTNFKYSDASIS